MVGKFPSSLIWCSLIPYAIHRALQTEHVRSYKMAEYPLKFPSPTTQHICPLLIVTLKVDKLNSLVSVKCALMCFKWDSADRAKSASYLFICWWRWKVNINFINILLKARDSFPCSWTENKYKTIMYNGAVAFQRLSDSFTPYYCSTWKANHNTGRK